jgi:ubiquinone biosynthesis protein
VANEAGTATESVTMQKIRNHPLSLFRRLVQVTLEIAAFIAWRLMVGLRLRRPQQTPPQRLCRALERLGPTFVKLGQGFSLRQDLLPDEYITALQTLQDRVAPFDTAIAMREVERSLGHTIGELFAEFDEEPLAAASIAQVHRARLHDGRMVVVKVRRPEIREQIDRDMQLARRLARLASAMIPAFRRYQPLTVIRETWTNLLKETDFRQEARNIRRFMEAFQDSDTVYVPPLVKDLYSECVLVQVMAVGQRVNDPLLRKMGPRLSQVFMDSYLYQFFVMGLFHADPHPGNVIVMDDGRICFLDFGLAGFLDNNMRRSLAGFMQAFIHQDTDWLLDTYLDLFRLSGEFDHTEFRYALEDIVQAYANLPLRELSIAEAFLYMARVAQGENIRIPHNLLLWMRTMFLVENTLRNLDPDYNFLSGMSLKADTIMGETLRKAIETADTTRLRYEAALSVQDLPTDLGVLIHRLRRDGLALRIYHSGIETFEKHIDRSSNRVAMALVTMGLYIAASIVMLQGSGPHIGAIPVVAAVGYALALWFTYRLVRGIERTGRLAERT